MIREKIIAFVHHLLIYDYILFGVAFTLFLLFIILAILLRNRFGIAIFCVLLGFTFLVGGPTIGYIELHKYLFKNSTKLISQKRLHFVDAILVRGSLRNESKFNFTECEVITTVYKSTSNRLKNYIYKIKPLKRSALILHDIPKGTTKKFKLFVEPFKYSKEYNLTLGASCR